ncbi:siderophore-interacting protein [Cellulosimicrobium sp. CUA-896]|uniref:siderophore-interacting protein n=1 Tax=Cellulosimicrobium sp. CUA-896 TaxID=1517881 RepID=UPI0035189553
MGGARAGGRRARARRAARQRRRPGGVGRLTLAVDETGLPAAARWVEAVGADVPVTAVVEIGDDVDEAFVEDELGHADVEILYRTDGPGQLAEAVRALGGPADDELVVAAGEAGDLVPVRRHLRRTVGARPDQLASLRVLAPRRREPRPPPAARPDRPRLNGPDPARTRVRASMVAVIGSEPRARRRICSARGVTGCGRARSARP